MASYEDMLFRDPPSEDALEVERAAQIRALKKDQFLIEALQEEGGRLFFWDFLGRCRLFENHFVPGSPDATAFSLGERNIGLAVLADIMRLAPERYVLMAQEGSRR